MARLTTETQAAVLRALVEGSSIRSVERMTGVHRDTITKLVLRVGRACERLMDEEIRHVRCDQLQLDELWCFVGKKRSHIRHDDDPAKVGDFWTWVALDPDSKLVPGYHVGKRTMFDAHYFMRALRKRVEGRVQLNSDKLHAYRSAILYEWSEREGEGWNRPDWGTIVKRYAVDPAPAGRYSPPQCVGVERRVESGNPDPDHISTSHVERQHLTMRMGMRRFTRLTNGFSKKAENLRAAVALHFAHYNFVRVHRSTTTPRRPWLPAWQIGGGASRSWWRLPHEKTRGCTHPRGIKSRSGSRRLASRDYRHRGSKIKGRILPWGKLSGRAPPCSSMAAISSSIARS